MADAEIGGQEGIGIAEHPHGDVARGPGPDARQGDELTRRGGRVATGLEAKLAARHHLAQATNRAHPCTGEAQPVQLTGGQRVR